MELGLLGISVVIFVGLHVLFIIRPLFVLRTRLAIFFGIGIFFSIFAVYGYNGTPYLVSSPPASFDVATSLINQALVLHESNPEKATALLREAIRHSPTPTQQRIITIVQNVTENAERIPPTTQP